MFVFVTSSGDVTDISRYSDRKTSAATALNRFENMERHFFFEPAISNPGHPQPSFTLF
jgi:hypothetical protein